MYAFAALSLPLSFLALASWRFNGGEPVYRAYARGLLFGLPVALAWSALGPLYRPSWGSLALIADFLLGYFALPLGLSLAAYALSPGYRGLTRGHDYERLSAYLFGTMTVSGLIQALKSWGVADPALAIALPALVLASVFALPFFVEEAAKDGMPYALGHSALALAGLAFAAFAGACFFLRLAWLGALATVSYCAGAAAIGFSRLAKRH